MSVINTNVKSLVAQDALMKNNRALSTSMQRLSTGSRINSAKDDAAGLAISTRMDSQVRGLSMAIKNANDGISLLQTAEGAMDEVTGILQRMRELSVQSVNGTNNDADRVALNDEITQLKSEIDRIASTTEFNSQKILDGSFKDKKLQIGDKSYQTMDIAVGSVATKDLGMAGASFDSKTLVSGRVSLGAVDKGDIVINDQALGKITATDDMADVVRNINQNVDNVVASAFNTVQAKQIGTGIATAGQILIKVKALDATSATTYSLSASSSLQELADNINAEAGAQVQASIDDSGKLVLSNTTGATIEISDSTGSTAGSYETATGFKKNALATYESFTGFLKLDSKDGNPIRIERGNLSAVAPGATTDLAKLGLREVTSQVNNALDAYTLTGTALSAGGVTAAWGETDIKINGVKIYDQDIETKTFQGKLDAINNFSDETGVIAYAYMDKTISFSAGNFLSDAGTNATGMTAGAVLAFNGTMVYSAASGDTMADVVTAINAHTAQTGIIAKADGYNLRLTGSNVTSLRIGVLESDAGTASANTYWGQTNDSISYASIRLDSANNQPISIELGDSNTVTSHGFLEQNVGAADFQVNSPTLGVGSGKSLTGLNVSTATSATEAIKTIDNAIEKVSSYRSKLGAMENRLNATVNNLSNVVTNTQASRSRIQDTDYASETTALAKAQIISQAATAMLAQANQQPQSVLSLLK
jgi:flagellin